MRAPIILLACGCSNDLPPCGGKAPACHEVGRRYELGTGVKQDATIAGKLYDKGCNLGEKESCAALGRLYEGESPALVDTDTKKAADATMKQLIPGYEQACAGGQQNFCEVLGDLYATGQYGMARDVEKAKAHYTTACGAGSSTACKKMDPKDPLYQLK